jgi:hypothetical protein
MATGAGFGFVAQATRDAADRKMIAAMPARLDKLLIGIP